MAVEQIRDSSLDGRHGNLQPQAIDDRDPIRRCLAPFGEAVRRPDEPAGEPDRLEQTGLAGRDDLHIVPFCVGVAV